MRFLITDDDDVAHVFLRHVLLGMGDVNHAFSGQEAVEACQCALDEGEPFQCVLMDQLMPSMNGSETIGRIRALHDEAGVPVPKCIMVSCLSEEQCRKEPHGECWQADHHIAKPFGRAAVMDALEALGLAQPAAEFAEAGNSW